MILNQRQIRDLESFHSFAPLQAKQRASLRAWGLVYDERGATARVGRSGGVACILQDGDLRSTGLQIRILCRKSEVTLRILSDSEYKNRNTARLPTDFYPSVRYVSHLQSPSRGPSRTRAAVRRRTCRPETGGATTSAERITLPSTSTWAFHFGH